MAGEALENISQEELTGQIGNRLAQASAGTTIIIQRELATNKNEKYQAHAKNTVWNNT